MNVRYRYDDDDVPESLEAFGERLKGDLRQEYLEQQNLKQFWNYFYGANPELRADMNTVLAVYNEHISELMNMQANQAVVSLAQWATERIDWLRRTAVQRREASCFIGGPGQENTPVSEQAFALPPETMGDTIKARKRARYAAQHGHNMRQKPSNVPTYGRGE